MPSEFNLTRQMPCSIEAEQAILGTIIIDSSKMNDIADKLVTDDFYLPIHQQIYETICFLFRENTKIDAVTVLNELVTKGIFDEGTGKGFIKNLADTVPSLSNISNYVKIVKDKANLRRLIIAGEEITEDAFEQADDVDKLLDRAEQKIYSIAQGKDYSGFSHISDIIRMSYDSLEERVNKKGQSEGSIKTGYSDLDKTLVELSAGNLVILGARPGIGKTSFALNIAPNVARTSGKTVAIFSLEMSKEEVANRIWTCDAMVDNYHLRTGEISDEEFDKLAMSSSTLSTMPIYVDDTTSITVTMMKAKLRRLKNLGLVIIDYLGLMASERHIDNKANEVAEISRGLKVMAKEFKIPIIVLCQLSRDSVKRTKKEQRPQLSDLRDSGAIEQDADIVMFLYKPDEDKEKAEAGKQNTIELTVAKNRHGEQRTIMMGWMPQYTKFTSAELNRDDDQKPGS